MQLHSKHTSLPPFSLTKPLHKVPRLHVYTNPLCQSIFIIIIILDVHKSTLIIRSRIEWVKLQIISRIGSCCTKLLIQRLGRVWYKNKYNWIKLFNNKVDIINSVEGPKITLRSIFVYWRSIEWERQQGCWKEEKCRCFLEWRKIWIQKRSGKRMLAGIQIPAQV